MWNELNSSETLEKFLDDMWYFHDSCVVEMHYVSGAYVNDNLSMYPTNSKRTLSVIIHRQYDNVPKLELEFNGLKYLKLTPADEEYTCEILDATMLITDNGIYWCDCGGLTEADMLDYNGMAICAEKCRWRELEQATK